MMKLVLVESPSKSKTIQRYLGSGYRVLSTYGHLRDLVPKAGSVDTDHQFALSWEYTSQGRKHATELIKAAKESDEILLAMDPDREGEGIAWHVKEIFTEKKIKAPIWRITFHEVTKSAILKAIQEPRKINMHLVNAYLTRRTLDYLFGFGMSPVLWRKLPKARSAGRVQSVALRFIDDKENAVVKFVPKKYATLQANLQVGSNIISVDLISVDGKKIPEYGLSPKQAHEYAHFLQKIPYTLTGIHIKTTKQSPYPPFTTSTLQQAASIRLGFSAKETMYVAQMLYEGITIKGTNMGLITYMRTDSITLSNDALTNIRNYLQTHYPHELPEKPRIYKKKVKNAQEAHEAIRPTNTLNTPTKLNGVNNTHIQTLYTLIWNRAVASQMTDLQLQRTQWLLEARDTNHTYIFQTYGQIITKQGFTKVWPSNITENSLPTLQQNEVLTAKNVEVSEHQTKPPARFNDASLIKALEEKGIGRPSTYSTILSLLQDRGYTVKEKRTYVPTDIGRILIAYLKEYATNYVDPDFTSNLEDKLDAISRGETNRLEALQNFWDQFNTTLQTMSKVDREQILQHINQLFLPLIFKEKDTHSCPKCGQGYLTINMGRQGLFIGCTRYPECTYTHPFTFHFDEDTKNDTIILEDLENNASIKLRHGPYGDYMEKTTKNGETKRYTIPSFLKSSSPLSKESILWLTSLPKQVGTYENEPVQLAIGPFGPYLIYRDQNISLPKKINPMEVQSVVPQLISAHIEKIKKQTIGIHPKTEKSILFKRSRFGTYLQMNKKRYPVQKGVNVKTLEQAIDIIQKEENKPKQKTKKTTNKQTKNRTTKK